MRKFLLVFGLLCTLFVKAQYTEPVVDSGTPPRPAKKVTNAPDTTDNGAYTIYSSNPEKNYIIAYLGSGYGKERYALLEYSSKKKLTPFVFERMSSDRHTDLCEVRFNGKSGMINFSGQVVIPCLYDRMNKLRLGADVYYVVSRNERYGILNAKNEIIAPLEYDYIRDGGTINTFVEVVKNGKHGFMNVATRKLAFSNWYTKLEVINKDGATLVELNKKKGLIDLTEKKIIPLEYDELGWLNGIPKITFIAAKGKKYGIMGIDGKIIVPFQYDLIKRANDDLLIAAKAGKKGLLKLDGTPLLPFEYDEINSEFNYLLVKKANKYGVVSSAGKLVLPAEYDTLSLAIIADDKNNYFRVGTKNGKKGITDIISGKPSIDFIYDDLIYVSKDEYTSRESFNNRIVAVKDGKYGIVERYGRVMVPCVYEDVQDLNEYLAIARKNGKYGVVDNNNNAVLPFEYEMVSHKGGLIIAYKGTYERYLVNENKVTRIGN